MNKISGLLILLVTLVSCDNDSTKADAYGNFEAQEIYVSAKSMGEINNFLIEKGQFIEKNTLVGVIDTSKLVIQETQVNAKKAAIKTATDEINAQIKLINTKIESLVVNRDRMKKLVAGNAASQQKLDNLNSEIEIAQDQINQANAKKRSVLAELKVLDSQIDLINSQLKDCKITNPIAGIVLEKFVENNEFCVMGKPLYKVANLNEIELKAYLSANQLSAISLGQTVQVAIDGANGELIYYDGLVSWISSEAEFTPKIIQTPEDRLNLVYAVKIKVINDGKIKIGMPGELYFNSKQ